MVVLPHVLAGKNVFCGNAVKAVKGAFQYLNGLRKKFVGSAFSSMIFFTSAKVSLNKNSVKSSKYPDLSIQGGSIKK
jgi:hypothetical protein